MHKRGLSRMSAGEKVANGKFHQTRIGIVFAESFRTECGVCGRPTRIKSVTACLSVVVWVIIYLSRTLGQLASPRWILLGMFRLQVLRTLKLKLRYSRSSTIDQALGSVLAV